MKSLQSLSLAKFSDREIESCDLYGGANGGDGKTFEICRAETNSPQDEYACGDESTTCTNDDGKVYHERSEDKYCI